MYMCVYIYIHARTHIHMCIYMVTPMTDPSPLNPCSLSVKSAVSVRPKSDLVVCTHERTLENTNHKTKRPKTKSQNVSMYCPNLFFFFFFFFLFFGFLVSSIWQPARDIADNLQSKGFGGRVLLCVQKMSRILDAPKQLILLTG